MTKVLVVGGEVVGGEGGRLGSRRLCLGVCRRRGCLVRRRSAGGGDLNGEVAGGAVAAVDGVEDVEVGKAIVSAEVDGDGSVGIERKPFAADAVGEVAVGEVGGGAVGFVGGGGGFSTGEGVAILDEGGVEGCGGEEDCGEEGGVCIGGLSMEESCHGAGGIFGLKRTSGMGEVKWKF